MFGKTKGNLEKIVLTGIGAMATTVEKSKEIIDDLAKKGEVTVEQGKALNEELKHTVKTAISEVGKPAQEFVVSSIIQHLDKLTPNERAQILAKLQELEELEKAAEGKNETEEISG